MAIKTEQAQANTPGYIEFPAQTTADQPIKVYSFYHKANQYGWMANTSRLDGAATYTFPDPIDPTKSTTYVTPEHYFQAAKCNHYGFNDTQKQAYVDAIKLVQNVADFPTQAPLIAQAVFNNRIIIDSVTGRLDDKQLKKQATDKIPDLSEKWHKASSSTPLSSPKHDIVRTIIQEKMKDPIFVAELLKTDPGIIVEATSSDKVWGAGSDGQGKNELGLLWMEQREKQKKRLDPNYQEKSIQELEAEYKALQTHPNWVDQSCFETATENSKSVIRLKQITPYSAPAATHSTSVAATGPLAKIFNDFNALNKNNAISNCQAFKSIELDATDKNLVKVTTHNNQTATIKKTTDSLEITGTKESVIDTVKNLYLLDLAMKGQIELDEKGEITKVKAGATLQINPQDINLTKADGSSLAGPEKDTLLKELDKQLAIAFQGYKNVYQPMDLSTVSSDIVRARVGPGFLSTPRITPPTASSSTASIDPIVPPGP